MKCVIELRQDALSSGPGLHALILLSVRMHDQCHETTLCAEASRNARVARNCNNACTLEANADQFCRFEEVGSFKTCVWGKLDESSVYRQTLRGLEDSPLNIHQERQSDLRRDIAARS